MSQLGISDAERGRLLLAIARATLAEELGLQTSALPEPAWLAEPCACFVTLKKGELLRGCVGSMQAYRSLLEDLRGNSRAAAFSDPRFSPLKPAGLDELTIEVSLLSPLSPVSFDSEEDLLRQLRPRVDGLLLEFEGHRGTFLPAVWSSIPVPGLFLAKLKAKASLPEDFWSPEIQLKRYTTRSWSERDFAD